MPLAGFPYSVYFIHKFTKETVVRLFFSARAEASVLTAPLVNTGITGIDTGIKQD